MIGSLLSSVDTRVAPVNLHLLDTGFNKNLTFSVLNVFLLSLQIFLKRIGICFMFNTHASSHVENTLTFLLHTTTERSLGGSSR